MKKYKKTNTCSGMTLIEILITLTVLAILVMIAAPSMNDTVKKSNIRGHLRDFQSALAFARGEAVSRARSISMCASRNASTCIGSGDDWSAGWIVFVEEGAADGARDTNTEELLRVYEYEGSNTLTVNDPLVSSGSELDFLTWTYRGFSDNETRALAIVCEAEGLARYAKGVMVASSGRAVATRDTDGDGVHETLFEQDDGTTTAEEELSCP